MDGRQARLATATANERFGLTRTSGQFEEALAANAEVSAQARASSFDNFRLAFDRVFLDTVVRRNEAIFKRILDDSEFQPVLMDFYAKRVFDRARGSRDT